MKKLKTFFMSVIVLSLLSYNCIYDPTDSSFYDEVYKQEFEYSNLYLETFFVFQDSLPEDPYAYTLVESLYASVNELYTWYANPGLTLQILQLLTTTADSAGAGIEIDSINGHFVIVDVIPNSPGHFGGLAPGDTITAINDTALIGFSLERVRSYLSGIVETVVSFHVKRQGGELDFTVTLNFYYDRSVKTVWLDTNTAYIAIEIFSVKTCLANGTAEEFREALSSTANAAYTIIDLRGNPGGEINQCIQVCSEFVEKETKLVSVWERYFDTLELVGKFRDTSWLAVEGGAGIDRKFYVLMDGLSASASEILISALNSNRPDIKTVGSKSYGKGRAQMVKLTPEEGLAFVTHCVISSKNGDNYDVEGIEPEISITTGQDALIVALADIGCTGTESGSAIENQINRLNRIQKERKARQKSNPISLYIFQGTP